jgi:hypothetical protein
LPNSLGKLLTLRPPAGERLQILTTNPTAEPRQNEYSSTTEEKSEVNPRFNGHGFIAPEFGAETVEDGERGRNRTFNLLIKRLQTSRRRLHNPQIFDPEITSPGDL